MLPAQEGGAANCPSFVRSDQAIRRDFQGQRLIAGNLSHDDSIKMLKLPIVGMRDNKGCYAETYENVAKASKDARWDRLGNISQMKAPSRAVCAHLPRG
jgi:hypothetical protein